MSAVVVVGASAGGVEALTQLARRIPRDLDAAVFVVLHVAAATPSALPHILTRHGAMRAEHARDGEPILPGRMYVAPPDRHVIIGKDTVGVRLAPKVNGHRPAIDPTFISAARAWGTRAAGVILSGTLDDGAVGLAAIESAGGLTVVQSDALFPAMPESARHAVKPDFDVPVAEIGAVLEKWIQEDPRMNGNDAPPVETSSQDAVTPFTCPECGGSLMEAAEIDRFRCRVGHEYSGETLVDANGARVEAALWTALRSMEERADLLGRLADRIESRRPQLAEMYRSRAREIVRHHAVLRETITDGIDVASSGVTGDQED
jgi:two-component system chemotaxis response regulator CheB